MNKPDVFYGNDCVYCIKGEKLKDIMIEICTLSVSTLYLLKDQTYRGRCIVALNNHQTELFNLDEDTRHLFSDDVSAVASAIFRAFNPQKINYAIYGDLVPHLHYHLVPKLKSGDCWGKPFNANPENTVVLSEKEYQEIIDKIKKYL